MAGDLFEDREPFYKKKKLTNESVEKFSFDLRPSQEGKMLTISLFFGDCETSIYNEVWTIPNPQDGHNYIFPAINATRVDAYLDGNSIEFSSGGIFFGDKYLDVYVDNTLPRETQMVVSEGFLRDSEDYTRIKIPPVEIQYVRFDVVWW